MKKIAIMGGTFDPIHIAHISIAQNAVAKFGCDKVIFMTSGNPPHKNKSITSAAHRFEMVKLAVEEFDCFLTSDYEIEKQNYCYTVETIEYLHENISDAELFFIIGADSLADLLIWKNPEKLFAITQFLVFQRGGLSIDVRAIGAKLQTKYDAKIFEIESPNIDISSTEIREMISAGNYPLAQKYVPDKVISYIKENNLYK